MTLRSLATVTVEERAEGSFVILRTDRGGQVHYGPFAPDGVEAAIMHLGSALATTAMQYQTVLRGGAFGAQLHEQGLQEETPDKRREIAEQLAATMAGTGSVGSSSPTCLSFWGSPWDGQGRPMRGWRTCKAIDRLPHLTLAEQLVVG